MTNEKLIEIFNTLIEINNDRIEGYDTASKETEQKDLKTLFFYLAQTSQKCKQELIDEVHKLGGENIEGTSTSSKLFRLLMDVKVALSFNERTTILDSCVRVEQCVMESYDEIIQENFEILLNGQKVLLNAQYMFMKNDHDTIKNLRDSLQENEK